jgi:hypothetical protein
MQSKKTAGQKRAQSKRMFIPRPGVISEIQSILTKARDKGKMLTVEQILSQLARKFPERDEAGMEITVRAQLSRLPKERKFGIHKERNDRYTTYAAA